EEKMPATKYHIELNDEDRRILQDTVSKGKAPAKMILRANILLASDSACGRRMTVAEVAATLHTSPTTVQTARASYAKNGLDLTIHRKKRSAPPVAAKVTGEVEARIIAMACGAPPDGYGRWSVRLLAARCVELGIVPDISHMTVARLLKKTNTSLI
ncbi:MAG: helix-turn-helix domain-containing protein, partial [Victivallales bacterium]|nr:helix-turn-helix domain-containing protein [Victivallales bacterium]